MNKYIIFISILSIGIIVTLFGLGRYLFLDTEYLFGWGRFKPFPEEIRQKHAFTIEKVDALIRKESIDSVTSRSEKFNLENYLGIIKIGVLPELKKSDPHRPDTQSEQDIKLLIEDIEKYIKNVEK